MKTTIIGLITRLQSIARETGVDSEAVIPHDGPSGAIWDEPVEDVKTARKPRR